MTQDSWLRERFPRIAELGYRISSEESPEYNCIAWAVGDNERFWDPVRAARLGGYYWPDGLSADPTLENWIAALGTQGYGRCETHDLEQGYEKVVIYVGPDGLPQHAARQLSSGLWVSKLGTAEDIEHASLDVFDGSDYGSVGCVLRRRVSTSAGISAGEPEAE